MMRLLVRPPLLTTDAAARIVIAWRPLPVLENTLPLDGQRLRGS
jgi:hypothetical protein